MDVPPPRPSNSSDNHERQGPADPWGALTDTWNRLRSRFPALKSHVFDYASVQADRVRLSIRNIFLRLVLVVIIAIACATAVVTATLHAVRGLAGGIRAFFSDTSWLGELAGGIAVLLLLFGGLRLWEYRLRRSNLARMLARFRAMEPGHSPTHVDFEPQVPEL